MEKYTGDWSANNNSTYSYGYTGNNKKTLARDMREICQANVFAGNTGHWEVTDANGTVVARGTCRN